MVQLVLRDISPILYPPPSTSGPVALTDYTSSCYDKVDLARVMAVWDPRMARMYRTVADLDWVSTTVESYLRE